MTLKEQIKQKYTLTELANELKMSRRYLYTLLEDENKLNLAQLKQIVKLLNIQIVIE